MKNYLSIINVITKIIVIVISVIIINYGSHDEETKVENINLNKTLDLEAMTATVAQLDYRDIYGVDATYTGSLTGYSAHCEKCGGHLGCTGQDVKDGTLYYEDETYGKVRIVASSKKLECGSIITFSSTRVPNGEIVAIVLDRGVSGNNIDLLTESEEYAKNNIGRSTITYDVLRTGWSGN